MEQVPAFVEWIQNTDLSTPIREGGLPYPIIGGIHLRSIALFGGMLLVTDLRLLGWTMQKRPVSDVMNQFRVWKWLGLVVLVVTGVLFAGAEAVRPYKSASFWVKMVLFALVGAHALVFRAGVYGYPARLDNGDSAPKSLPRFRCSYGPG